METKPTVKSKRESYQKVLERYRKLRTIQKEHLDYYECNYASKTGQKVGQGIVHHVLPPIAQEIIDPGVNMMGLSSMIVHIPPAQKAPKGTETEQAKSEADTKEKWVQTLVDDLADIQPYSPEQAAFFYCVFGESFLHIDFDWDYVGKGEEYEGNPFSIKSPDPTSIYASLNMDKLSRPAWLYQKKVMLAGEARELLYSWQGKKYKDLWGARIKDYEMVYWVEWWEAHWRGIITGTREENIKNWEMVPMTSEGESVVANRLGWVPFIRLLGGKGFFANESEPEGAVRGALRGYETQIVQLAREQSKIDTLSSYFAAPIPHVSFENSEAEKSFEAQGDPVFGPGIMVKDVKGQYEFKWERPPDIPDAILENVNQIKGTFEKAFPGVVSGQVSPGEPAASMLTRLAQGTLRWTPLERAITHGLSNACSCVLEVVDKHVEGGLELNGMRLTSEIIKGHYRVDIELKSNNPTEKNMQELIALQWWGKLPRRKIWEKAGFEDASQIEIDMVAEQLLDTDPQLRQSVAMEAARLIGLNIQEQEMKQPGGAPGGMMGGGMPRQTPTVGEQVPGVGGSPGMGVPGGSPELVAQNRMTRPLRRMQTAARGQP